MSLKPPVSPNAQLGTGRVFWNVVADGGAQAGTTTSQSSVFQTIINDAGVTGGTVFVPDGTYKLNTGLTLATNVHLKMSAGAVLDFTGASSSGTCISATGSTGSAVNLSADAAVGDTALSVAAGAESGFTAGDYVQITSSRKYDPGYTDTPDGEIGIVASTASGTVTVRSPLNGLTYTTANSATITKLTMVRNVKVSGGKITGTAGQTQKGIKFDTCVNARVVGTEFSGLIGVWFAAVQDGRVDRVHVESSNSASVGYGVNFSSLCQDCTISNSFFRDCEHSTTVTGSGNGIARRILITDCTAIDTITSGDCFDSHACVEDVHFRNCISYDAGNDAFQIEAAKASVIGCVAVRPTKHGIQFINGSAAPTEVICTGNSVVHTTGVGSGIIVTNSSVAGTGSTTNSVVIANNTIRDTSSRAIYVVSTDTWRYANVQITGNVIQTPVDTTVGGIQLQKADNCTVANNIVTGVAATSNAYRIVDVTSSTIAGNVGSLASLSNGRVINVTTGVDLVITGNRGTNGLSGIALDSGSSTCTVVANNMRGCTTPLNLAGSSHVVNKNLPFAVPTTASATTVTLPLYGDLHIISGTTTITSVTADTAGRTVTLKFSGILTFTDGSNLKLAGDFVTTADDAITLISDGTNWIEIARSVN